MKRLTLAFLGFAAALVLSGCGIRGDLDARRPSGARMNAPQTSAPMRMMKPLNRLTPNPLQVGKRARPFPRANPRLTV